MGFILNYKLSILNAIKSNWKNNNCDTAFCQKCGVDLNGFHNYCDTCKRDEKIEKILENEI